jgi:hypothetical protein
MWSGFTVRGTFAPREAGIKSIRHPGLDPGSTFFPAPSRPKEGGCRIKSGMTTHAVQITCPAAQPLAQAHWKL